MMGKKFLLILIILFANILNAYTVNNNISVDKDFVYLKDLIKENYNGKYADEIILNSPLPGRERIISRDYIEYKIKNLEINSEIKIPEKIILKRKYQEVDTEKIKQMITSFVNKNYTDTNIVELKIIFPQNNIFKNIKLPGNNITYKIRKSKNVNFRGREAFFIEIYHNQEKYKTLPYVIDVRIWKKVIVAKRNIKPSLKITTADVEIETLDVTKLDDSNYFTELKDILGKVSTRYFRKGRIIERNNIEEENLIKRGDIVTVYVKTGNLYITSKAESYSSGKKGEKIKLRAINSKKFIYAIVEDKLKAKIIE